ncbi:hypothetical protein ACFOEX_07070 [Camelimonas abortus]|uniref:Uncharacterized protein n=1 Tax=Camelimonas abortus TaxID=1017184 RepID=A0ABV7LDT8_9HYPH
MPVRRMSLVAALVAGVAGAGALAASPALAQTLPPGCEKLQTLLLQRKAAVDAIQKLSGGGKKKMDPRAACAAFGKLVANGAETIRWVESNRAWCQIPDSFAQGLEQDHKKAGEIRAQACKVAAQITEMEKRARAEGAQGGGLLGGPGLTGQRRIPSGAL